MAATIRGKADVIITLNLKDSPKSVLSNYDMDVQSPDEFILKLINLDKKKCLKALTNQVKSLNHPPKTREEVLETLINCSLTKSVGLLKDI